MNSITLHLDQSSAWRGLFFESAGQPVSLETALREGFCVSGEDSPAVLTLIENFIRNRDENAK